MSAPEVCAEQHCAAAWPLQATQAACSGQRGTPSAVWAGEPDHHRCCASKIRKIVDPALLLRSLSWMSVPIQGLTLDAELWHIAVVWELPCSLAIHGAL